MVESFLIHNVELDKQERPVSEVLVVKEQKEYIVCLTTGNVDLNMFPLILQFNFSDISYAWEQNSFRENL